MSNTTLPRSVSLGIAAQAVVGRAAFGVLRATMWPRASLQIAHNDDLVELVSNIDPATTALGWTVRGALNDRAGQPLHFGHHPVASWPRQ